MASEQKTTNLKSTGKTRSKRTKAGGKSKKDVLIEMLNRKNGADVPAISKRLDWQNHTTRAALSRLRKSGFEISSEKTGNGKCARYRITAGLSE